MALTRNFPRLMQYVAATSIAVAMAFPFVCAMVMYLSFGMALLLWLAAMGFVFAAPVCLLVWWLIRRRSGKSSLDRRKAWQAWMLCLIVHLGVSAGVCRMGPYLPNGPAVKQGSFIQDYLGAVFMPVVLANLIAGSGARRPA